MTEQRTASAPRRPQLALNEIRRTDAQASEKPSFIIPASVAPYYHLDGRVMRSAARPDKIEVVDRGSRMHAYRPVSAFTIRSMVQMAEARGFQEIAITGDAAFQSRAYIEATDRNIGVKGYTPTAKDMEILKNRADRREAKENPKVQAFLAATEKKLMTAAAKKFPELKEAFAVRAATDKHAETLQGDKAQAQFRSAMNDRIALALHRGEPLPDVKIRQEPTKAASKDGQER